MKKNKFYYSFDGDELREYDGGDYVNCVDIALEMVESNYDILILDEDSPMPIVEIFDYNKKSLGKFKSSVYDSYFDIEEIKEEE